MGDPFLNYFALFLLIFVVVVLFYGIIAIHDIPAKIAESRHHPHQDAIHAAGWVSLFTCMCCGRFSGSGRWPTAPNAAGDSRLDLPGLARSRRPSRTSWRICDAASRRSKAV